MNILDQEIILEFFRANYELFIASVFICTFAVTYHLIPKVLWVSKERNLMAEMNERSAHSQVVPPFGGVAFYITLILVLSILQGLQFTFVGNHLIAAITILFMVGLKDDLVISSVRVKLIGQIIATFFVIFSPEMQLTNLYGFLGIHEIHVLAGIFLKLVIAISIINAYNLIDGIDGLGAIVGIITSGIFALVFYGTQHPYYVLISISMTGVLAGFLRYNFSRRKKMFMGDSGSLIIGLLLAFLTLKHLVMEPNMLLVSKGYNPANRFLFLGCVLFIPVFDTLRIIVIRKLNRSSAFTADRNHVHHVLLDLGLSHFQASVCLGFLNLFVVAIYFAFSNHLSHLWLILLVVLLYTAAFFLFYKLKLIAHKKSIKSPGYCPNHKPAKEY